jgi:hypothetical protein
VAKVLTKTNNMNKEIEIEDYCGTITWLCMDDEIEFEAKVYYHFEEDDDVVTCEIEHIYLTQKFKGITKQVFPDRELSKELADMVIELVEESPNDYGYQQQLLSQYHYYYEKY